jgi:ubiquinone/menaquinone biosynthesis C-methylase UbiE
MDTSYQNEKTAKNYFEFINSENGLIQRDLIFKALISHFKPQATDSVLDAACGSGWLSGLLHKQGVKIEGCDFSQTLIDLAKKENPEIKFQLADLNKTIPYPNSTFSKVIFNMAAHDVKNLENALCEISRVTKPGGIIFMSIANPYYAFPVGVWKRGLIGFLLRLKPKLRLRWYFNQKNQTDRSFVWNKKFISYFYTLPEYIAAAKKAGLTLEKLADIGPEQETKNFNLSYQLSQFPILLFLIFKKGGE